MIVVVSTDAGATSESAEPSRYPDPKGVQEDCARLAASEQETDPSAQQR
jgi:hypothetical protein